MFGYAWMWSINGFAGFSLRPLFRPKIYWLVWILWTKYMDPCGKIIEVEIECFQFAPPPPPQLWLFILFNARSYSSALDNFYSHAIIRKLHEI